jgi:hypothetical protein
MEIGVELLGIEMLRCHFFLEKSSKSSWKIVVYWMENLKSLFEVETSLTLDFVPKFEFFKAVKF